MQNAKLGFSGLFSLLQRRRGTARGGWGEHHLVCANGFLVKQKPWFLSNFFYFNNEMLLRKTIVCVNRVLLIHHQRWSPFPAGEGKDKSKFDGGRTQCAPTVIFVSLFVGATYGRPSKQCGYPINQTINNTCTHTIHNDWTCYCKHFSGGAEDKALCWCQVRTHYFVF